MCTNPEDWQNNHALSGSFTYENIIKQIEACRDQLNREGMIYLTGGEPTIHPDFLRVIKYLSREFPDIRISFLTNGRMFAYDDFARQVISACPNLEVEFSLCGYNPRSHDSITGVRGSFEQAVRGLDNLLKFKDGRKVNLRFVLTALSKDSVIPLISLWQERFAGLDSFILIFWEIEGLAGKNMQKLSLKYEDIDFWNRFLAPPLPKEKLRLYHFPLCAVPEKLWPNVWRTLEEEELVKPDICRTCSVRGLCSGLEKDYYRHFGGSGLKPQNKRIKPSGDYYKPIL